MPMTGFKPQASGVGATFLPTEPQPLPTSFASYSLIFVSNHLPLSSFNSFLSFSFPLLPSLSAFPPYLSLIFILSTNKYLSTFVHSCLRVNLTLLNLHLPVCNSAITNARPSVCPSTSIFVCCSLP